MCEAEQSSPDKTKYLAVRLRVQPPIFVVALVDVSKKNLTSIITISKKTEIHIAFNSQGKGSHLYLS